MSNAVSQSTNHFVIAVSQSTNHCVIRCLTVYKSQCHSCLTKSTNHCLILCLTELLQPAVPLRAVGVQTNSARCADTRGGGGERCVQTNVTGRAVCRQTGSARCADKRRQHCVQTNGTGSTVCRQTGVARCADKRGQRGVQTNGMGSAMCRQTGGSAVRRQTQCYVQTLGGSAAGQRGLFSPPVFGSPRTLAPAQEGSGSTAPADSVCQ